LSNQTVKQRYCRVQFPNDPDGEQSEPCEIPSKFTRKKHFSFLNKKWHLLSPKLMVIGPVGVSGVLALSPAQPWPEAAKQGTGCATTLQNLEVAWIVLEMPMKLYRATMITSNAQVKWRNKT
jgi:hypothetical protein